MKKVKNIIIANDAEAFNEIIGRIKGKKQREEKMNKEHFLSSRFLFWEGDNKIVITPFKIEEGVLGQLNVLGYKNIECWSPKGKGINLCDEIRSDKKLFNNLVNVIRDNSEVTFSPYSYTKEFKELVAILRKEKLIFKVDQEPAKKNESLVKYLGSKVGFRIETNKINITSPEFFICKNKKDAIKAGEKFSEKHKSFVIKATSGEGGWGVLIIDKNKYPSKLDAKKHLSTEFINDPIWEKGPFVVEEFIESNRTNNSSPSVEVFITEKNIQITYICNQIVDKEGKFIGILIGKDCVEENLKSKIYSIAKKIGRKYKEMGYKGFFDIDFIISKDNTPYPVETNVRRTGGTHVYDLIKHTFGDSWIKKIVSLSTDSFCYKGKAISDEEIIKKLGTLKYSMNKSGEGVIIVAVSKDKPVFSLVIFASTKTRAINIHKKISKIFK